jgi:4-amino-4-deoxychorismate lyase
MSLLFETLLYENGIAYNLKLHELRMNTAREYFWKAEPVKLIDYIPADITMTVKFRIRIDYASEIISVKFSPYNENLVKSLQVVVSDDIEYSFKFSNRTAIDELFTKRKKADDILIIKKGDVTDISIGNIVFTDGNNFFTPSTPLLKGIQRKFLLDKGIIKERRIMAEDIPSFTGWQHINALNPLNPGRFNPINSISLL